MLAEVDRSLTFRLEYVARQRDRDGSRRSAMAAALDTRAQVEQTHLSLLHQGPNLARLQRARHHTNVTFVAFENPMFPQPRPEAEGRDEQASDAARFASGPSTAQVPVDCVRAAILASLYTVNGEPYEARRSRADEMPCGPVVTPPDPRTVGPEYEQAGITLLDHVEYRLKRPRTLHLQQLDV